MKRETHKRTVAKSLTWRILATATTFLLVLVFTGDLTIATSLSLVEVIAKLIIYYVHDRAWNRVKWGVRDG